MPIFSILLLWGISNMSLVAACSSSFILFRVMAIS